MTRYPVTVGLLRSCRWRLRTRSVLVLLCYGMFWWMWASIVLCLVMFTWPIEAIVGHSQRQVPTRRQVSWAGYAQPQRPAVQQVVGAWCRYCRRWNGGRRSGCHHCGAPLQ